MCGIAGLASFLSPAAAPGIDLADRRNRIVGLFKALWAANDARGGDAAGVAVTDRRRGRVQIAKGPVLALTAPFTDAFRDILTHLDRELLTPGPVVVVGHTRMGTGGSARKNVNNHPFQKSRITGVHNGIFAGEQVVAREHQLQLKGECDSEVLFALADRLARQGEQLAVALQKALESLYGSYAVVALATHHPQELLLYRGENPLDLVWDPDTRTLFYSSQEAYVDAAYLEGLRWGIPLACPTGEDRFSIPLGTGYILNLAKANKLVSRRDRQGKAVTLNDLLKHAMTVIDLPDGGGFNFDWGSPFGEGGWSWGDPQPAKGQRKGNGKRWARSGKRSAGEAWKRDDARSYICPECEGTGISWDGYDCRLCGGYTYVSREQYDSFVQTYAQAQVKPN